MQHRHSFKSPRPIDPSKPLSPHYFAARQFRLTVSVLLTHPNRRGLLLVQSAKDPQGLTWMFPQGGVNLGESIFAAARRELREELPSFARVGKREPFRVSWKTGHYLGSGINEKARSGVSKEVHVVAFQAIQASIAWNTGEISSAMWVHDVDTFRQLMQSTKEENVTKYRIVCGAVIGALRAGLLRN